MRWWRCRFDIFHPTEKKASKRDVNFQIILRRIGRKEDLVSNMQDSLVSLQRLSGFLGHVTLLSKNDKDIRARVKTLSRDIASLTDHASFVTHKINFLLDATLGMINIEQNRHHQDLLGRCRRLPAADAGRVDLRHELHAHAGAGLVAGLSLGHRPDDCLGYSAILLLQAQGMVVIRVPSSIMIQARSQKRRPGAGILVMATFDRIASAAVR